MKRIFSLILALMAVQMMFAAKYTVTNTSDDVEEEGSLRWACETATSNDTIVFKFSTKGDKTIHISQSLSTNASIDGSTWADSIIIDGYDEENGTFGDFTGISGAPGKFVNKIVVQKCRTGFLFHGAKLYDCIARNCYNGFTIDGSSPVIYMRCKALNNKNNGFNTASSSSGGALKDCDAIGNNVGVKDLESSIGSRIYDNKIGILVEKYTCSEISDCVISGNESEGVYLSGSETIEKLSNNIIGLTADQKEPYPNGYGIYVQSGSIDSVKNNVISGNRSDGIKLFIAVDGIYNFVGNYVGTNRFFDRNPLLGNGGNGFLKNLASGSLSSEREFSKNYFGYNAGYGLLVEESYDAEPTISDCYFGITPDGIPMPNGKGGLKVVCQKIALKNCHIGYNEGSGLDYKTIAGGLTVEGGMIVFNKENGIIYRKSDLVLFFNVKNVVFDSNGKEAISYLSEDRPLDGSLFSENKFLHTVNPYPAISTTHPYPVPEFTSCKMTEKTIEIVGKVEFAGKLKIELFYTSQGEQTAEMFVDSFDINTKTDGVFSISLDRSKIAGKSIIGFSATATYNKYNTSPLSSTVYPEMGKVDLTSTEFYVKMDGYGDGSSWENAMSPYTFAYYLPQVKDGSTFHVAEGRYLPVDEDKNGYREFKINSSVSIIGGYPTTAKTGAASDPKHYKTIFTGDPSGDDSYIDDDLAYDRDVNDPNKDDINVQSLFNAEATSEIYFYGCGLVGSTAQQNGRRFATTPIVGNLIKLERCELDMVGTIWAKDGTKVSKLEASECIFRSRSSCSSPSSIFSLDTLKVEKSLFEGMKGSTGGCFSRVNKAIFIENSTFTDIISSSSLYEGGKLAALHLLNNTFNNLTESGSYNSYFAQNGKSADIKIIGNIFVNCSYSAVIDEVLDNCEVRDNLCSGNTVGTDLDLKTEYIDDVLEWRRGAPVLKDNGGFTPTMALKRDKLIEGASIRFPRLDNIITDQRGESRPLKTCMGAYEFGCPEDTTMIADTIEVDSKFAIDGKLYDKIGIYKDILSKHTSQIGCDSVVNHTLFVVPSAKIKEYYVKTSKAGKGDGSSWDNAMDSKDFAYVFENLQTDGVTFYIAAGTYYAVYNGGGKETNDKVSHWSSRHGANIYGGYDPKSTGDASTTKANPVLYRTIFTGDINGDDHVKIDSDCGYTLENFTDNMTTSMLTMELYSDVHISGIEFTGMSYARGTSPSLILLYAKDGNKYKVTIDHCKLNVADKGISISNVSNVMIDNCEFEYIRNSAIYSDKTCTVSNSTFAHTNGVSYNGNNSELNVKNSTFVKNRSDLQVSNYSNFPSVSANIYNNTFISCDDGSYIYVYDNVTASVEGNIFAGPMIEVLNSRYDTKKQSFTNNLFACKSLSLGETTTEKNNIKLEDATSLYNGILKGTYSAADAIFTPELTDKGAFTRTVALLDDKLEDGTPIRFPRLENVLTDQRGVSRFDETCMGAYEIGCPEDTTVAIDTIVVGTKFVDGNLYEVGRHDSIFFTYKNAMGCDSVVNYTLFVTPDPKALNYYVKTKKVGDGDGRDWDNAMDGDAFAMYLPLAPDDATFHVAAGEYVKESNKESVSIKNNLTIIGAYPENATKGAVPDPKNQHTHISLFDILYYREDNMRVELYNLEFSDLTIVVVGIYDCSLIVDKCKFFGYGDGAYVIYSGSSTDIKLTDSYFSGEDNLNLSPIIGMHAKSVEISGCTFERYNGQYYLINISYPSEITIYNSTVVGNKLKGIIGTSTSHTNTLLNNTIVGNVFTDESFHMTKLPPVFEGNIYAGNEYEFMTTFSNTNIVNQDVSSILDGTTDPETGNFSPALADNGGFTPTVALISDKLSDGESIRFPRLENVLTDQRGVSRFDETCMGAYEIGCSEDTTVAIDTIVVGTKFVDGNLYEVGRHDSIFMTYKTAQDCDSVVNYTLFVTPDPKTFNYYVKMKKEGKGDGSDWDNAMDSVDFATYLPLAPDGVTFYVAEGTYKPIYGYNLQIPAKKSGLMYEINSSVTIIGGYPADATGKDVPSEPKKYHTVFDGDIDGDDKIAETLNGDYLSVSVTNRKDNSSYMFFSQNNKELHVTFDGISVKSSGGAVCMQNDKYVKISNSEFTYNDNAVYMPYEGENLEVYNSKFLKNFSNVIYMPTASNLTMDSILFENNQTKLVNIPGPSGVNPNHNVRLNRIYAYANGDSSAIVYSIGHDFALSNSEFKNNRGLFYIYDNTRIDSTLFENNYGDFTKYGVLGFDINECTFVDNRCDGKFIYAAKNGTEYNHFSVTNSIFKNTDSNGLMYVVTDSVNISKSEISGSTNSTVDLNNYKKAILNNCYIHDNEHLNIHYNGSGSNTFTYLKENTINNNVYKTENGVDYLLDFTSSADSVVFTNNTFVSNTGGILINFSGCRPFMYNNTIVGNHNDLCVIDAYPGDLVLRENIILGNSSEIVRSRWSTIDYKNNILPRIVDRGDVHLNSISQEILDENIISIFDNTDDIHEELKDIPNRNEEILTYLFEGKYNSETGLFTPVLANNGGFTPTVALKSDKLSDGTSIRFPRLENVLTDQRGVERFDETCMGAYEMRCTPIITELKDTVVVGDSYTFNEKNLDDVCQKVGSYYFSDTLAGAENCDSIVKLSLAVRPQKNENGYYVKVDGTGDGSDWDHAMSPKDFAEYLPLVYDGETFHIAAGTYKSTYEDPELGRMYNINSSVTLIGGYPDTVTSTSTPSMPDVFVTKLTADVRGNDYTYYYPNSLDLVPYSNFKDNDSILIRVNGEKTLTLYGMTLSGVNSCDKGAVDLAEGSSLVMDRCFVQNNAASGVYGRGVDVKVTNSVFTHNYSNNGTAFNLTDSKLNVQSSAVYENMANIAGCDVEYSKGGVASLDNTEATFENSTLSNNAADLGSAFSVKSAKLDLINNTIVGNQIIPTSKYKGSVIGSLDDKSSVSLFGNIVIGNQPNEFDGVIGVNSSDYNVFSFKTDMPYGEHDMIMNDPKEVQMLLDGEMVYNSDVVFIPNVQYNGGYTPTVAVIQSAFDGGKILNIPLDDRKVTYDQRGFVRKDSSCIGAFEFPTFMGYYVKKQTHGDGSGRDWENSMNDTTFAKYFPIVPTNASFHIAEGVYSPMFDSYGKLTDSKSRRYSSSRLVNIYGGYPDSAQTGCEADPIKYKTVFSVDYDGDDKYVESESGYSYVEALNTLDNGYSIVNILSKIPGWIEINGVEFRGQRCVPRASSTAVQIAGFNTVGVNAKIEKCSFIGNYSGLYAACDSIVINECLVDSTSAYGLSLSSFSTNKNNFLLIDKSTIANTQYPTTTYSFRGQMRVQNSTFANVVFGLSTPGDYMVTPENTKVEIYNNSIFSGKKGDYGLYMYDFLPIDLKGNIIASDKVYVTSDPNRKHESMPIVSDYNIYTTSEDLLKLGENDTIVPQSSIAEVVKGTMENGKFEAAVEDQEIYVKIPTLINVKFNEGGGIKRMPENATPVTEDQTGESRPAADYCIGALEADCEFKKANFKLELAEEVICRDDTAIVTLTGLTKKEKETYKFAWTSSKDSVYVVDTFANPGKSHVYARQATVPLQMTITNICGVDTVLEIVQNVNGVGSVPFDGVEEGEVFCQNAAEPVKLTTAVDGAIFTGECVVKKSDGYYFDATKAKGDSTRVRCSIQDGDCRSFDEKTIQFFKFEGDTVVEIASSTQTKNVCMEKPQAQSVFTVKGWREGLTCKLNGLPSTLSDSTVTKDSVLTVTYASLKNGEYIFEVSDECKPIASETIKIENEEIDPDMLILSLDTVVANTQTCDGGEFGDVRVEYSGNINNADVVIVLSSNGTLIKSDTLSEENAFVVFDNLKPAVYDAKIFFDGMEDCTTGDANYSRTVDVTKPVKFEVAFSATQAICENSIDAMMLTKTSGGNTPYTYKWTKYVGDIATSTVSHTKTLHDTLPDLVKNEVYLCDVVDNYGCAASSDTLKIIYDHADSTMVDTFIYDPYQRCKGKDNAQMIVDFSVVSDYAHPVYTLEKLNEDNKYAELDVKDNASALNKILLDNLAPGKYKLHVGYPSVGCPSLVDTMVEIKELVNEFKFEAADSIRMPHCYANNDAAIYFHAIGASRGLTATFSYKKSEKTLYNLTIDSLAGDTAYFVADNLPNDSFVVKMKNVCGDEITYEYKVGAPGFGIEKIDSLSFKTLKCRYDSTGITAFRIHTGDNDSAKVTLRYSKQVETIFYYKDTTYTTVEVPIYRMEPRVKDTIWNADSTEYDVRYERDPITNEIIVDTIVTYETRDTMIIETKNRVGYRNVDAEFPCKFDTVYGKDTVFIYSGLPGGIYFIDLVSTINGCKDSLRTLDTINIPNPVSLNYQVLDVSCKSKTDGVISLKPVRSGGGDRTFVLKHDSTFKDGKYEYEMCYIGYTADGETTVNNLGMEVKKKVFVNYYYGDYPLMTRLNRISNKSELYKKDGDKYIQIQGYEIDAIENNLKRYIFGNEWKSIRWTKKDATGHFLDFTIVTPDSTTYEEDVYYSGPDIIKTAVWSYTHLSNFWKDEYGEWLASGVQTIANLPKGVYNCVVTDTNDCVYSTNITVSEPKDPLTIVEVTYDAVGALCDPTKRHIDMKVKGGWGDYNYMVMDGKPVEGNGGLIDNYLGATSITYDTVHAMGVYRSQFLDPGKYRVAVVDGKGCRIEFDDDFEVKTNFTVEGSVEDALCPGEESAPATFVIHDPEKSEGYKYAVKEHIGSCDTPYDCVDDLNFVDCKVDFVDDGMTFTKKITGGGHGFFIYRLDTNGDTTCGTYVRVSAVDTLKPMTLSKKSITHVTCNGSANGEIELYVLGGKAPYIVDVNPSWGSDVIDQRIENLYPEVDPTDTMGKFPRIIIKNLKARDYYFTITDSNKCHQRFGDTAIHTAKLTVKEPDALTAEFGASSMCANAGAADDPNYGSVFAQDVKGGTAPYLFSVTGGLEVKRELDGGNVEYYHESVDSDDPFIPVAGYKETEFHYTIEDSMGCQISKTLMFGQEEIKSVRQKEFLATTWSHYGDVIALIDFCGPESTFDSVSYKFSNEKVKMLDKRLYIYDLDNPKRGATPNAKNIVLSYHDTREVPDGFFIENFNMVKDMTPLLAAHINFVAVTDKSDLYKSTNHAANDSLCLKTDVVMSSYFKGCRYQVEIKDFLKVAYDNVELYYGGVDKRKNILDIVVNPNPRTEDKPCTVNVYFADNTEDCVLSFYHMDGSEIDRVTIHAGDLKVTKYDHDKAYVYTYNVEDDRFDNVEVVVISAMTNHDSKGSFLLNASSVGQ